MSKATAEIAKRVRAARGYAGLSQDQLADCLGVHAATVLRWESVGNEQSVPPLGMRIAITVATGVRPDWFDFELPLAASALERAGDAAALGPQMAEDRSQATHSLDTAVSKAEQPRSAKRRHAG